MPKKQKQNAYMKEYKRKKKNNESETEKLARRGKQNIYMREYNRRKKNNNESQSMYRRQYNRRQYNRRKKYIPKKLAIEEKQNTKVEEVHAKSVHGDFKMQAKLVTKEKEDHAKSTIRDFKMQAAQNIFNCIVEKELAIKQKQNVYIKEYKRKKKNNESETEKPARPGKQNIYVREYNRRKKDIETETDQNIFNGIVDKEKYLSLFDSQTNGPIHSQEWAKKNMRDFHNSLKFKIYKCNICHEAWPLSVKHKEEATYVCSRCVRDKNATKKFQLTII